MNAVIQYTPKQALFELSLLNAEEADASFDDVVVDGISKGIPAELLTRLRELWEKTKKVGGEVIAVGKIIVRAIFNFLKANPDLTIGMAIGAAFASLIALIPFIGPILAPSSVILGGLYGAGVGATAETGGITSEPLAAAIALAKKFFELLGQVFNAVADYWKAD